MFGAPEFTESPMYCGALQLPSALRKATNNDVVFAGARPDEKMMNDSSAAIAGSKSPTASSVLNGSCTGVS